MSSRSDGGGDKFRKKYFKMLDLNLGRFFSYAKLGLTSCNFVTCQTVIFYPSFSHFLLANATFGLSLAFQMSVRERFDKINFSNNLLKGRFNIFHLPPHLKCYTCSESGIGKIFVIQIKIYLSKYMSSNSQYCVIKKSFQVEVQNLKLFFSKLNSFLI